MIELDIKRKLKVTTRDLCDILSVAIEGGISYWATRAEEGEPGDPEAISAHFAEERYYRYMAPVFGGTLIITDGIERGKQYTLTGENLSAGLQKMADDPGWDWLFGSAEFDAGNVDENVADSIIQMALFGEEVYG